MRSPKRRVVPPSLRQRARSARDAIPVGRAKRSVPATRVSRARATRFARPTKISRQPRRDQMTYVDGFIVPVPKKKVKDYVKIAKVASKVWKDHGALEYIEAVADDVKPGKWTSFPQSVKLKKDEVVIFSYIVYKNRAARNKCMKNVMKNTSHADMMKKHKKK